MDLHDLITLIILLIGTSETNEIQYMKYTSAYIPKLQIHQQYADPIQKFKGKWCVEPQKSTSNLSCNSNIHSLS